MLPEISEIAKRRKRLGITQVKLARLANVSQSFIAKLEAGKIDPSYSHVKAVFDSLEHLEKSESVTARHIMTPSIISARADEPVSKAIRIMQSRDISQLPVTEKEHIIGCISEDAITARMAQGSDPSKLWLMRVR